MTSSLIDTLTPWGRRPRGDGAPTTGLGAAGEARFRLRAWPELPDPLRVAPIYRMLSTMTVKPVTRNWMLAHSGLGERAVDGLLGELASEGVLVTLEAMATPQPPRAGAARF